MTSFKLGIFGLNSSSGVSFTKKKWAANSDQITKTIKFLDKSNKFDFILPISSWVNFGGSSKAHSKSYETFSFASIFLPQTKKIKIYSTVHVPFLHPIYAARLSSTINSFFKSRHGINIVCGWSRKTFQIFDSIKKKNLLNKRYKYASEWLKVYKNALIRDKFSFKGKFFNIKGCELLPKTGKKDHKIISAAYSHEGQNFAYKNCDILFTFFSNFKKSKNEILSIKKKNKKIKIYTTIHVVCKKTNLEAEKYFKHYSIKHGDFIAAKNFVNQMPNLYLRQANLKRLDLFTASLGSFVVIGDPKKVASQIKKIKNCGFDGVAISFVDYYKESKFFVNYVLKKNLLNFKKNG